MEILQEGDGQTGKIVLLVYALRDDTFSPVWISAVAFWKQSPEQRNWWGENLDGMCVYHRIVELEGTLKAIWSNSPAVNRDTCSSIRCSYVCIYLSFGEKTGEE